MSKWKKEKRYGLVDLDTGEMFGANITAWKSKIGGRWVKKFQEKAKEIALKNDLHGQSFRVLAYLEGVADWKNQVPGTADVGKELSIVQTQACRAYTELVKIGVLIKHGRDYYLSPLYCWKGSDKDYELACKELLSIGTSVKVLPPQGLLPPSSM